MEGFLHPPQSARPMVFWHWMSGNITKTGIRKDLLDMKRCGISGVMLFNVDQDVPPGAVRYGSDAWYEHVLYAMRLCDSLGLTFINTNCPGWSTSGGPWIKPAQSMKVLTWSEHEVKGGSLQRMVLPMPPTKLNYYREIAVMAVPSDKDRELPLRELATITYSVPSVTMPTNRLMDGDDQTGVSIPISHAKEYIELSFRQPLTASLLNVRLGTGAWIYTFAGRITYSTDGKHYQPLRDFNYYGHIFQTSITIPFDTVRALSFRIYCKSAYRNIPLATDIREIGLSTCLRLENKESLIGRNWSNVDRRPGSRVDNGQTAAIDLSALTNARGELEWNVPKGNWTILRMGYTSSGTTNHPAPPEATGLEVDKLDAAAVAFHFQEAHKKMLSMTQANSIASWKGIILDSYEAGLQNWSHDFLRAFEQQHGYDLKRYLPVLTGRIMGSYDASAAVLWDYRKTISTLFAKNFYGTTQKLAHNHGMKLYVEPYAGFFDTWRNAAYADMLMGEFWMYFGTNNIKLISSAAHAYGKTFVGAEAFTAVPQYGAYQDMPSYLKARGDLAFTDGLNLHVLHSYVHQPQDVPPGYTLGRFGSHFGRLNTWWRHAPAWIDYLSRVQHLLQQGSFVGDVCVIRNDELDYLAGEDPTDSIRAALKGYDFDFCSQEEVLQMRVQNGRLYLPQGQDYRVLVLPPNRMLQWPVLKHLQQLIQQGAIVVGLPPVSPSGLTSAGQLAAYEKIRSAVWNNKTEATYGRGKVYTAGKLQDILRDNNILPDVETTGGDSLRFIHRRTRDADIYFISNQANRELREVVKLRTARGRPQLWHPVQGKIHDIDNYTIADSSTSFLLSLAPYGSTCVVFTEGKGNSGAVSTVQALNVPAPVYSMSLGRSWELQFLDGMGAPASMQMDSLRLWNTFAEPAIKYYSGTVAYSQTFHLPDSLAPYRSCELQLEQLYDLAAVRINGREVGVIWTKPYTIDITSWLHQGSNSIELQVTNRWINRLIGDEQDSTQQRYTFSTYKHYTARDSVMPSGLAGKVLLGFYR
ncbi:hypothetical protein L3C95_11840 [Chitinophaga filiformis]|uniref:glycosyl hydrolase n=1 Tax=Chitinophaga filiformis TaxID=104663 RepID=UPI001F33722E|nr:glycosyl hydrolase [Chitinophaga filiformis]MCF6403572.1 hypothetical protein [Chitinophaga filiformis]